MNQQQTNLHTMHKAVKAHFTDNENIWIGIKPLATEYTNLVSLMNQIEATDLEKSKASTKGLTSEKESKIEALISVLEQLIKRVRPYAKTTKNIVLLNSIDFSKTDIERLGQEKIFPFAQKLLDDVKPELYNLADYKVDTVYLDMIQSMLDTTKPLISKRDNLADQSSTANDNLIDLFKAISPVLKNLDDIIDSMVDDKDFVATYKKARMIVDRGGKTAVKEAKKVDTGFVS